jgi:hypothetical protein
MSDDEYGGGGGGDYDYDGGGYIYFIVHSLVGVANDRPRLKTFLNKTQV